MQDRATDSTEPIKEDIRAMLNLVRWMLLISFIAAGFYLLAWAFQSASFSVPAEPIMSEIYKTQSLLLLPLSVLFFSVAVLFFLCLRKK